MTVLVTGSAGFIGNHVALALLERGERVVGVDALTPYYEVALKEARVRRLIPYTDFREARIDLADRTAVADLFAEEKPDRVIHLAAQAGVRYSIDHPNTYIDANLVGFHNVLEGCRQAGVRHLVYASTSSIYGANGSMPYSERQGADHQLSLYAATKKANEAMAHTYAHLFNIPCTGLRFFTVYGPWGRPDMALFKFTRAILAGQPIPVFNQGAMRRDFTYIDDIVEGVVRVLDVVPEPDPAWDSAAPDPATSGVAPWRIFNIGRGRAEALMDYIAVLERALGRRADKDMLPMQPGDVPATWADTTALAEATGYAPATSIETGVHRFVEWYTWYYNETAGTGPAADPETAFQG